MPRCWRKRSWATGGSRTGSIGCWTCISPKTAAGPEPNTRRQTWPCCDAGSSRCCGRTRRSKPALRRNGCKQVGTRRSSNSFWGSHEDWVMRLPWAGELVVRPPEGARVEDAWRRIVAWYEANTPPGSLRLPTGASESALRSAEREMVLSLPSDLRAFYRIHDGLGGKWLLHYGEFNTLDQLVSAWRGHRGLEQRSRVPGGGQPGEVRGPIRPVW